MSNTDLTRTSLASLGSTGYVISGWFSSVFMHVYTTNPFFSRPRLNYDFYVDVHFVKIEQFGIEVNYVTIYRENFLIK